MVDHWEAKIFPNASYLFHGQTLANMSFDIMRGVFREQDPRFVKINSLTRYVAKLVQGISSLSKISSTRVVLAPNF